MPGEHIYFTKPYILLSIAQSPILRFSYMDICLFVEYSLLLFAAKMLQ